MKRRWVHGLLFVLIWVLAGCFQQAGEAFQPADNTVEPIPLNVPNTPSEQTTPIEDTATLVPATSALPITVISPPTRGATSPTPQTGTTPTVITPQSNTAGATATTQFITPGGPPLPVPSNTPAQTNQSLGAGTTTAATPSGLITPTALTNGSADGCTYIVQPGDNLYRISVNNNVTVEEMRAANPELVGEAPILQPGQLLQVPGCSGPTTSATTQSIPPTAGSTTGQTSTGGTTYTVQSGDTLFSIARQFGVTVQAIVEANAMANPDSLSVGQELIIPPAS
jgi:LysM repeat protein